MQHTIDGPVGLLSFRLSCRCPRGGSTDRAFALGDAMSRRVLEFTYDVDKDDLSIRIGCEHGSLISQGFMGLDNIVSTRYMVNELMRDKDVCRAFDIVFEEIKKQ